MFFQTFFAYSFVIGFVFNAANAEELAVSALKAKRGFLLPPGNDDRRGNVPNILPASVNGNSLNNGKVKSEENINNNNREKKADVEKKDIGGKKKAKNDAIPVGAYAEGFNRLKDFHLANNECGENGKGKMAKSNGQEKSKFEFGGNSYLLKEHAPKIFCRLRNIFGVGTADYHVRITIHICYCNTLVTNGGAEFALLNENFLYKIGKRKINLKLKLKKGKKRKLNQAINKILSVQTSLSSGNMTAWENSGMGGSIFFFSADQQYILKSVQQMERNVLLQHVAEYAEFMDGNRDSFLTKYYGFYSIQVQP